MNYQEGQKVQLVSDGKVYDFGYYSETPGKCILYEEGEMNMQDSFAVPLSHIRPVLSTLAGSVSQPLRD